MTRGVGRGVGGARAVTRGAPGCPSCTPLPQAFPAFLVLSGPWGRACPRPAPPGPGPLWAWPQPPPPRPPAHPRPPRAPPSVSSFPRRSWRHVPVTVAPACFSLGTKCVRCRRHFPPRLPAWGLTSWNRVDAGRPLRLRPGSGGRSCRGAGQDEWSGTKSRGHCDIRVVSLPRKAALSLPQVASGADGAGSSFPHRTAWSVLIGARAEAMRSVQSLQETKPGDVGPRMDR